MRKFIFLFALLSLATLLVGCKDKTIVDVTFPVDETDKPNEDGTVSIEFYGWGSAEEQAIYQELIDAFMDLHPNIKVAYTATSPETYMRVLQNRVNNLPDVFYMPDTEFLQWADAGRLLNFSSQISDEDITDVWPEAIARYRYDRNTGTLGEGGLYALPKDLGPFAMVYNKTLFNEIVASKGLSVDLPDTEVPMTWAAFVDLLKQLEYTKNGQKAYGITHYELPAAVYSNNADFMTSNGDEGISDPNFVNALQFVADLSLVHHVMPDANAQISTNGFQRFSNGGAVFSFAGPWDQAGFWKNLSFEWDLLPIPVGSDAAGNITEGAKSTAWVGSMGFAISSKTTKATAALELVKFLSIEQKSQEMNYQLGQAVPNLISVAEDGYLENVGLEGNKQFPVNKQEFLDIIRGTEHVGGKARPQYYTYDSIWYEDLLAELGPVWLGERTAQQFANSYKDTLQDALEISQSNLR